MTQSLLFSRYPEPSVPSVRLRSLTRELCLTSPPVSGGGVGTSVGLLAPPRLLHISQTFAWVIRYLQVYTWNILNNLILNHQYPFKFSGQLSGIICPGDKCLHLRFKKRKTYPYPFSFWIPYNMFPRASWGCLSEDDSDQEETSQQFHVSSSLESSLIISMKMNSFYTRSFLLYITLNFNEEQNLNFSNYWNTVCKVPFNECLYKYLYANEISFYSYYIFLSFIQEKVEKHSVYFQSDNSIS